LTLLTLPLAAALCLAGEPARGEAARGEPAAGEAEFFEKRVRPLLVEHCQKCHGAAKEEAGLRLDSRARTLKGGDSGPAVEPGKPDESLLVEAIGYGGDIKMPPKRKLADEEIAILTDWVRRGAPWPADKGAGQPGTAGEFDLHGRKGAQWAFQPIRPQTVPAVNDVAWATSTIDRYLLAKLEAAGLRPAPAAEKPTLLRRVTFDLIGLPPTPAELAAFLADDSPRAFARVVDRLLDSPHYGERFGRHWLDLVRYAETCGHEFDFEIPNAWQYRDYVVRAFNADVPYDQFVTEQIAGDLLPEPRRHPTERFNESIIGTGFWYLGESKHSPVDVLADEAERIDNQIDVFGKAFLGQTLGCARCHDHKFDALSTKDYYALSGYLQSSRMQTACVDPPQERGAVIAALEKLREERAALLDDVAPPPASAPPAPREGDLTLADFSTQDYHGWFVTGDAFGKGPVTNPVALLPRPGRGWPAGARGLAHSGGLSGRLEGVLRSRTFTIEKKHILYLAAGKGTRINLIIDGLQHLRNPIYGSMMIALDQPDRLQWHVQDVAKWIGHSAYIELVDESDGFLAVERIVFSDIASPQFDPAGEPNAALADLLGVGLIEAGEKALRTPAPALARRGARLAEIAEKLPRLEEEIRYRRKVLAIADGTPEDDRVHLRGSPHKLGDVVPRRFLEAVAGADQRAPAAGSGRLELARRVVDPDNPLLPRVIVNRLWKYHFGEGLVRTPDDFGNMGQPPTHPELLDYLAGEFLAPARPGEAGGAWSFKRMHRALLLTRAYQMSSRADDPHAEEIDPQNKLLHRMNLRRLEGEIIRDAMLAVSGRLDPKGGGPGVLPYLTPFMAGRGRPEKSGPLDGDGRRSIYIGVRRNFLTPLFLAFDYPVPFTAIGRRSVSNVPAQALALMNNSFVIGQAELWAQRAAAMQRDPEPRLRAMYLAAFSREPTADEQAAAREFLADETKQAPGDDPNRPWADLAHVLFNVKEFIFVE
jgi:mono/diheme cytochrome c family protein